MALQAIGRPQGSALRRECQSGRSDIVGAEAFDADGAFDADDAERSIVGGAFLLVTEDVAGGDEFAGALGGIGLG